MLNFQIQSGERRPVGLLIALYFLISIALVFTEAAAFGLFLSVNGAEMLPYAYLSIAVGASLAAYGYLRLSARLRFSTLLTGTLITLALLSLIVRLGLTTPGWIAAAIIFALPLWLNIVSNLGELTFWGLASSLFTVRQKKRLWGLISAGGWAATIAGGLIAERLVGWLGTSNLLLVAAVVLFCAVPLLRYTQRTCPPPLTQSTPDGHTRAHNPSLLRNRYLVLIFAFTFVWWLGNNIIQTIFSARAEQQFPEAEPLAEFLASFAAASGVIGFVMNVFVTAPVVRKYGLWGGLLITPILVTGMVAVLLAGSEMGFVPFWLFGLTTMVRLVHVGIGFSLDQTSQSILLTPLPSEEVERVAVTSEGIVQPLAVGSAGGILLLFEALRQTGNSSNGDLTAMSVLFLVVGGGWIVITISLVRAYKQAVSKALAKRQLGGSPYALLDSTSIELLQHSLRDSHPGAVVYALHTLAEMNQPITATDISALITHPAMDVRREAYGYLEQHALCEYAEDVKAALAQEPIPEVREAGWRALAALSDNDVPDLEARLHDDELADRRGALVGLLRYGGIDGVLLAGQTLHMLSTSTEAIDRGLAAQVLGTVGVAHYYQPLVPLLQDASLQVRRSALGAAGCIRHARLWPLVIRACAETATRHQAILALAQGGDSALPFIETALAQSDLDGATQIALIQSYGRIGGERAIRQLMHELVRLQMQSVRPQRYRDIEAQVIAALVRCQFHANHPDEQQIVRVGIQRELAYAAMISACLHDLQQGWPINGSDKRQSTAVALLVESLEIELRHVRNRLLELLSFLCDRSTMLKARYALMALDYGVEDAAQRAYAVELVDTHLSATDKANVLAIIEPLPAGQRLAQLGKSFQQARQTAEQRIQALSGSSLDAIEATAWTRACALYAVRELNGSVTGLGKADIRVGNNGYDAAEGDRHMLSIVERVIVLKTANVFAQTPADILAELAELLEEKSIDAGTTIFRKGDPGDSLYLIVDGAVEIRDGEHVLHEMHGREVFGEMALLDNEPRSATVVATEPTHMLWLAQQAFYDLLMDRPEIAAGIIRVLTGYVRKLNQRLITNESA